MKKATPMEKRVARFSDLTPMEAQRNPAIKQEAADMIWSRKLMPVITYGGGAQSPFGTAAPIEGAGGMSITLAVCPPGTGPGLHTHHQTYETFTVMQGAFEFRWGDEGDSASVLKRFDTISVPPGVCRAFRNVSDEEGILQVIITGGIHDIDDIAFPSKVARELEAIQPGVVKTFEASGLRFNATTGA